MSRPIESCGRVIEFLAQMPTDTKIFSHKAVLSLANNADSAEMADLAAPLWAHVVCELLGRVLITRSAAGR